MTFILQYRVTFGNTFPITYQRDYHNATIFFLSLESFEIEKQCTVTYYITNSINTFFACSFNLNYPIFLCEQHCLRGHFSLVGKIRGRKVRKL